MAAITEIKDKKTGKTIKYKVRIRVKGYPTMTATFDKKTAANQWIAEHEPLMKQGKHISDYEAKKHTLSELIDRYIDVELPKRKLNDQNK